MSATLDVWISKLKKPCQISDRKWYVSVYGCEGQLLDYCGKKYLVIPAPCGHIKLTNLPPGTYKISAVWNYYKVGDTYHGNHFTHSALVNLCCHDKKCVVLYNPSIHYCGIIFNQAMEDLRQQLLHRAGQTGGDPAIINQAVDTAINANIGVLALAQEADPDRGVLFEAENIEEHNAFLKQRLDCEDCDDLFEGGHEHSDDEKED